MPGRRRLIALAAVTLVLTAGMACAAYAALTGTWTAAPPQVAAASGTPTADPPESSSSPEAGTGPTTTNLGTTTTPADDGAAATSTTAGPAGAVAADTGSATSAAGVTTTRAAETSTTAAPTTSTAPATTTTTTSTTTTSFTTTSTTTATTTTAAAGGSFDSAAEGQFVSSINGLRSSQGLPGLQSDGGLVSYARAWARYMAEHDSFVHSNIASLLGSPWTQVGENIAMGNLWPSVASLFSALVNSPGHYANMVNPAFTHLGVGVWVTSDGEMWTAHVFAG